MKKNTIILELPVDTTNGMWEVLKQELALAGKKNGGKYRMTLLHRGVMHDNFRDYNDPELWSKQYGYGGDM